MTDLTNQNEPLETSHEDTATPPDPDKECVRTCGMAESIAATAVQNQGGVEFDLARTKDTYKEVVSIIKDTLDVAWKVAPIAFLPAALFLWIFLRSIHWSGIFQDSAMSGAGLIFLFVATILIALTVVLQFIVPSLLMICTQPSYKYDRTIPKVVPQLYQWAAGGWLLGFALVILFDLSSFWIIGTLAFLSAFVFALIRRDVLEFKDKSDSRCYMAGVSAFLSAGAALLTMVSTSIPLLITIHATTRYAGGGWSEKVLGVAVCVGTTLMSLLPGYMYLNARTWNTGIYRPTKFASLGIFLLSYVVLSGAAISFPISSTILRLAGVYSNELQTFQVIQPDLAAALTIAGLSVHQGEKITLVRGYVRYEFGGTRLLCREPFDPSAISDDAIKAARKNNAPDPRVLAGSGCVQATAGELRPLRM